MITSIYFEDDPVLIQSAIDLVKDAVFDCWRVKPLVEISVENSYDDNTCVTIYYFNESVTRNISVTQSHEAVKIASAFIHGYIAGASRNGVA
jgi:hypothetical protein